MGMYLNPGAGKYQKMINSEIYVDKTWLIATVARMVEAAHLETAHLTYNNETALSYTLSLALYAARDYYTTVRELPAGKGFADMVFLPRPFHPRKPALLVELKWDRSADSAIEQMRRQQYPLALRDYQGRLPGGLLLVGIAYDKESRVHECRIEKM